MNTDRLTARLHIKEGFRSKIYKDTVGVPTIGYGRNLNNGITRDEAEVMLRNDIEESLRGAKSLVPSFELLTQARQEVLVEMAFNLGVVGLSKFVRMLAAVDREEWERAAGSILHSLAARQHEAWDNPRYRELAEMMRMG